MICEFISAEKSHRNTYDVLIKGFLFNVIEKGMGNYALFSVQNYGIGMSYFDWISSDS